MTYLGTTAASTASNPPRLLIPRLGGLVGSTQLSTAAGGGENPYRVQAGGFWLYASSDPVGTVKTSGYFSDGDRLGMKVGDVVMSVFWTTLGSSKEVSIDVVDQVTTAGASLSTSLGIASS